ncbi:MAG: hypothetical protein AAB576_05510, partial [Elusimicrobiota bacterium]
MTARPCPAMDSLREEWAEHDDAAPPAERVSAHLDDPLLHASPLLVTSFSVSYWAGVSERTDQTPETLGADPACYVVGSAAYYYNGTEDSPELDMVETVRAGGEGKLGERLVELRWFDPADGLRHRWFNVRLARALGWLQDRFQTGLDWFVRKVYQPLLELTLRWRYATIATAMVLALLLAWLVGNRMNSSVQALMRGTRELENAHALVNVDAVLARVVQE